MAVSSMAQINDLPQVRRNTLKYHVVSTAVYTKSLVLSYERITKSNQSFAIMAGYVQFPELKKIGSAIKVEDDKRKNGLTIGGEYRFYLKKENKYPAPHGVFIGPYTNLYHFGNDRSLSITSSDGSSTTQPLLKSDLKILNVGFQLGYQFVFNDRWSIDVVFIGPSVSNYSLKIKLDGSYDVNEEETIKDEILVALLDRFPLIKELLTDKEIDLRGRSSKLAPGFRYQLNVGYRFGKSNHKK
jgi:hypothetical protein